LLYHLSSLLNTFFLSGQCSISCCTEITLHAARTLYIHIFDYLHLLQVLLVEDEDPFLGDVVPGGGTVLLVEDEVPFLGDVVPGGAVLEKVAAQSPQER